MEKDIDNTLTKRQLEAVRLRCRGTSWQGVAQKMSISIQSAWRLSYGAQDRLKIDLPSMCYYIGADDARKLHDGLVP